MAECDGTTRFDRSRAWVAGLWLIWCIPGMVAMGGTIVAWAVVAQMFLRDSRIAMEVLTQRVPIQEVVELAIGSIAAVPLCIGAVLLIRKRYQGRLWFLVGIAVMMAEVIVIDVLWQRSRWDLLRALISFVLLGLWGAGLLLYLGLPKVHSSCRTGKRAVH